MSQHVWGCYIKPFVPADHHECLFVSHLLAPQVDRTYRPLFLETKLQLKGKSELELWKVPLDLAISGY